MHDEYRSNSDHSPLPWRVGRDNEVFAYDDEQIIITDSSFYPPNHVDAIFITRAVNCHYDLLEALKNLLHASSGLDSFVYEDQIEAAKLAIAKAEGK